MRRTATWLLVCVMVVMMFSGCQSVHKAWDWAFTSPAATPGAPAPFDQFLGSIEMIGGVLSPFLPWAAMVGAAAGWFLKARQQGQTSKVLGVTVQAIQQIRAGTPPVQAITNALALAPIAQVAYTAVIDAKKEELGIKSLNDAPEPAPIK